MKYVFIVVFVCMGIAAKAQSYLPFNSIGNDYAPAITADGARMYFSSFRKDSAGIGRHEEYYSDKTDTGWSAPFNCGAPINDTVLQGWASISADGTMMVITIWGAPDGYGDCDLYISQLRKDGAWGKPVNMGPTVNTSGWEAMPSISRDGNTIYFASDRPGGVGGIDIYKTTRSESGWGTPVNLKEINTPGSDVTPCISLDDSTLYFSSNYIDPVRTDMDIYMSVRKNGSWSKPVAVDSINTKYDEFFPSLSGGQDKMYYCSRRRDTTRHLYGYHIYESPLPPESRPAHAFSAVSGKVLDQETLLPLDAQIVVLDSNGKVYSSGETNPWTGEFTFIVERDQRYRFLTTVRDYYLNIIDQNVVDTSSERMPLNLLVEHVQVGIPHIAKEVFKPATDTLTEFGIMEMQRIAALMRDERSLRAAVFVNNETAPDDSLLRLKRIERLQEDLRAINKSISPFDWKLLPYDATPLAKKDNYIVLVPILN